MEVINVYNKIDGLDYNTRNACLTLRQSLFINVLFQYSHLTSIINIFSVQTFIINCTPYFHQINLPSYPAHIDQTWKWAHVRAMALSFSCQVSWQEEGSLEISSTSNLLVEQTPLPSLPDSIDWQCVVVVVVVLCILVVISVSESWGGRREEGVGGHSSHSQLSARLTLHHAPGVTRKVQEVRQQSWPGGKMR